MPLVSVIIPTYNRRSFTVEAVESVLNQSFQDYELIIVDDGSTDGIQEALKTYGNRLTYCYQAHAGVSAARNRGIRAANGKWIAFLDSDDLWNKHKLREEINALNAHRQMRCCYTNEIWIRNGVRVNPKKYHQKFGGWIFRQCLPLCIISASSVILHKSLFDEIGNFDESMPVCEDYDLWLRLSLKYPVYYIKKPLITKRGGHEDQLSFKIWGMDRYRVKALEKILRLNNLSPEYKKMVKAEIVNKSLIIAEGAAKRKRLYESYLYKHKAYLNSL